MLSAWWGWKAIVHCDLLQLCETMHPPYSPDRIPPDYHLFHSRQNSLDDKKLAGRSVAEYCLAKFFDDKPQKFDTDGFIKLPEKWQKVIDNNSQCALD